MKIKIKDDSFGKKLISDKMLMGQAIDKASRMLGAHIEAASKRKAPVSSGRLRAQVSFISRRTREGKASVEIGIMTSSNRQVKDSGALRYARIQDVGGRIPGKGNRSKHKLAIPAKTSLAKRTGITTRAGVSGVRARDVISSPAQFGLVDTRPSKSGKSIQGIFDTGRRGPRGGRILDQGTIFWLVKSVNIRPKNYLAAVAKREVSHGVGQKFLELAMRDTLKGKSGTS